jgi:hypothetical protein
MTMTAGAIFGKEGINHASIEVAAAAPRHSGNERRSVEYRIPANVFVNAHASSPMAKSICAAGI